MGLKDDGALYSPFDGKVEEVPGQVAAHIDADNITPPKPIKFFKEYKNKRTEVNPHLSSSVLAGPHAKKEKEYNVHLKIGGISHAVKFEEGLDDEKAKKVVEEADKGIDKLRFVPKVRLDARRRLLELEKKLRKSAGD
jgi:hypothetical protein